MCWSFCSHLHQPPALRTSSRRRGPRPLPKAAGSSRRTSSVAASSSIRTAQSKCSTRPARSRGGGTIKKVSRLIYPQETAVSPDCDAIATTGSATYKYTWLVEKGGKSVMIGSMGTPSAVQFDRTGQRVLIGTFTGMLQMHDRAGYLLLTRAVRAPVTIEGLAMINDNGRVAFQDRDTGGVETQYRRMAAGVKRGSRSANGWRAANGSRASTSRAGCSPRFRRRRSTGRSSSVVTSDRW